MEARRLEKAAGCPGDGSDGLQDAEAALAERSRRAQNPALAELLTGLQSALVYTDAPNHETNRKLWDAYASGWSPEEGWVRLMAGHLPGSPRELRCVGDEWSDEASLSSVLEDWLLPLATGDFAAAEIGSGGGRIAERVAGRVRSLVCFDVSSRMLEAARAHLARAGHANVSFQLVSGEAPYPPEFDGSFDLVYSFDVFVHMDLHQMYRTLRAAFRLLRPGGRLFVSFANLLAPAGWRRFERQRNYSVGGFFFISPDIARCLLSRAGFEICRVSEPEEGNTYLNRDLLVLAKRPEETAGSTAPSTAES